MKKTIGTLLSLLFCISLSCSSGQEKNEEMEEAKNEVVEKKEEATQSAGEIKEAEEKRLQNLFKKRLGASMPADAAIAVKGYEESPIEGFKKGSFVIQSSRGSGEVSFLISQNGRYIVFGEPIDTEEFEDTQVGGLKKGTVPSGNQQISILISKEGRYLIFGELVDSTVDPAKETMKKISLEDVPIKGEKDAEITIIEYSDFQCPYCKRAYDLLPQILEEYKGKVKVVYKQLPLSIHPWAKDASIASICAYKQGNENFWEFHDLVFENQGQITVQNSEKHFKDFAKKIGLDTNKFDECLNSPEVAARIQNDIQEAQSVGVNSTPTFIVDGTTVRGANPQGLKSAIDTSLSGDS